MTGTRGYTLVELVIATTVMLATTGGVMTLLHDGLARTPLLEEATELQQRARVAAEALAGELRSAGSGTPAGPLTALFPAIEPRRAADPPGTADAAVVTLRYVPASAARTRLNEPLEPAAGYAV